MGCEWNMPANYAAGVFEDCPADSGEVGIIVGLVGIFTDLYFPANGRIRLFDFLSRRPRHAICPSDPLVVFLHHPVEYRKRNQPGLDF